LVRWPAFVQAACPREKTIDDAWIREPLFLGLTPLSLGIAVLVTLAAYLVLSIALWIARGAARRVAARTSSQLATDIDRILERTSHGLMLLVALLAGSQLLDLPSSWRSVLAQLWFVVVLLQVAIWANRAITLGLARHFERHGGQVARASASSTLLSWALKSALWVMVLLAMLSNLGVNITAFVASLGIGGVAVALAVQNILGDLFASLSIALDKPFEVGDFIGVGGMVGTVDYVGLKTTRIRSLSGEQLIMSNADLLKQTISNYKRMVTRRIVFTFGVTYDTTPLQAEEISRRVKAIVSADERVRFDRAHLKEFGGNSINFEVVYIVLSPDYNLYMDVQQSINLELMRDLEAIGVRFALPTRIIQAVPSAPQPGPGGGDAGAGPGDAGAG
jgi:small-conductance mechanosensitive channel